MSVFGSIVSAIFGSKHAAPATGAAATAFIVRDSSIAEACGRRRGACDWGSRIAFATAFIVRDSLIAEACGRRRSAWCNRGNTDLESRRRSDSCQTRR